MNYIKTPQFDADQLRIEDHVFESNYREVRFVEKFIEELDVAVQWLGLNATVPKEDEMGDRSWPFFRDQQGLFRYRLKYLVLLHTPKPSIVLKRIIDNREQNLNLYPVHKLNSFSADDE